MYKLAEHLFSLAYAYADEINNYAEDYLVVRRVDAHNLLVEVRTEYGWEVCGAYVPINELPYRMAKRLTDLLDRAYMGYISLELDRTTN